VNDRIKLANSVGVCAAYGCLRAYDWKSPNGVAWCPQHGPRHLRPTRPAGCATMNPNKRYLKLLIIFLFAVGILGVLLMVLPQTSHAHTAKPAPYCDIVWDQAPPGKKWAAKQRCLVLVVKHNCVKHPRQVPGTVKVKGLRLVPGRRNSPHWRNQRKVVGWIVNEGLRRALPRKVVLSALVATTQESSARELDYGHGTSVGPFQLISDHGPQHLRETVEFSGNWYYNGAMKVLRRNPGIGAAALAQAVEQSAHPDRYGQWLPEANRTLDAVLGPCHIRLR